MMREVSHVWTGLFQVLSYRSEIAIMLEYHLQILNLSKSAKRFSPLDW